MNTTTKHTYSVLIALIITIALAIGIIGVGSVMQPTSAYADAPQAQAGTWVKSGGKWWYKYTDGTYPADTKVVIKGATYSFDAKGWMKTGWKLENGSWYYYKGSGAMATGWAKVKGSWYYMNSEGVMQTGWVKVDGKWYYLKSSGAMKTGWVQDGSDWYYTNKSGAMVTGWQKVSGKWYLLGSDGKMLTGKQTVAGKTYILASSGAMKTGWVQDGNTWYYCDKSGAAKTNTWISGKYWVGSDGVMATNGWVDNGKYYVDADGKWVKNSKEHIHRWEKVSGHRTVIDKPSFSVNQCSCGEFFSSANSLSEHQQSAILSDLEQGIKSNHGRSRVLTVKSKTHYESFVKGYECACGEEKPEEMQTPANKQGWYFISYQDDKVNYGWYYYRNGKMLQNEWVQSGGAWYWLQENGKMAKNAVVDNGKYYVSCSGERSSFAEYERQQPPITERLLKTDDAYGSWRA